MPIYSVRAPDGMLYDIQGPEGASEDQILNAARQFYFRRQRETIPEEPAPAPKPAPPSKERTFTEALIQDPAAAAVSGLGSLAQFPGQLYGLVSGDMDTVLTKPGRALEELGQRMKSPGLVAREQERSRKIKEAEEESGQLKAFGTALKETVSDPALLPSFLIEQAPNLIPALAMTKAVKGLTLAKAAAQGLGSTEAAQLASRAGVKAAIATAAVQQGADVGAGAYEQIYDTLIKQGFSKADAADQAINTARAAGASGAIISILSQKLPGAKAAEEFIAGVPGAGSRLGMIARGVAGESISEITEETGGKLTQNIALREVAPETPLTAGLGEAAAMAAIGGGTLGGLAGALRKRPAPPEEPGEVAKLPPSAEEPVAPKPSVANLPPSEPAAPAKPVANLPPQEFKDYETGLPDESADVFKNLQNRNRATPASIQQMQSISADPDYGRLKVSPDFSAGAPVVISDSVIDDSQLGRIDTITASDGRKIPVRYAVIDADDLLPSHNALGQPNKAYGDMEARGIRAVAGNGRIAGLQGAFEKGTAGSYVEALANDTEHGISPDVINEMNQPVLVRIMPKNQITPDIGDISNVTGTLRLSPVDTAKNDLKRIDLEGLNFRDDGSFDDNTLLQFVRAMPIDEQGELLDDKGRANTKAIDRLNNAIFYKAYNSEPLIDLYAQAADPEARMVLAALARAAAKVARLEGAGEYDIRKNIIDAAEQAVNAKRQGVKLEDFAQQRDIGIDDNTYAVMQMMANNYRSGKRMGELLGNLADAAYDAANAEPDMFGDVIKPPVNELFAALGEPGAAPKPSEPKPPKSEEPTGEKRVTAISKSRADIAQEINNKTLKEVVDWLINNAPNNAFKELAIKIKPKISDIQKTGIADKVKVINDRRLLQNKSGKVTRGRVTWALDGSSIEMRITGVPESKESGLRYETIMHEMLHVGSVLTLKFEPNAPFVKDLNDIAKRIQEQLKADVASVRAGKKSSSVVVNEIAAKSAKAGAKRIAYLTKPSELLTWSLTNKDFQDYMMSVPMKRANAFSELLETFRKWLGLDKKDATALEAVISASNALFEASWSRTEAAITESQKLEGEETLEDVSLQGIKQGVREALQKRKPPPPESLADVDPDLVAKAQPIYFPEKKTILDKIDGMRDKFWQRLAQGIADQFRTIKEYSEDGYVLARLSKSIDGALEGLLFHGHVFNDGGALNIRPQTKGFIEAMKPLGNEVSRYQMWVALNREASLPESKRSKLDNMDELIERRAEFSEGTLNGKPRLDVYKAVQKDLNAINRSVLKVALDAGLIDSTANAISRIEARTDISEEKKAEMIENLRREPIGYERFANDIWYIPFYREMEDGDVSKIMTSSGLTNQKFSEKLEGGASPFSDMTENVLRNWSHIMSASMKNQAGAQTLKDATRMGGAEPNLKVEYYMIDDQVYKRANDELVGDIQPWMTTSEGKGLAKVMVDGQPMYYRVESPLLLESIMAIGYMGPKSKFVNIARDFKNLLQFGVTISPAFKVRNLIRDSVQAMAISDLKKNPIENVLTGLSLSDPKNLNYLSALAGGAIFNFGSIVEGDQAKLVKRLIDRGVSKDTILTTPQQVKEALRKAWDKYQEWGNKSESANRMALYKQLRDKGMSHLQATYHARDLLDFSMQGAWPAFRLLTQTVPFLNARVQGLYKLGRDGIIPTARVFYGKVLDKPLDQTEVQKAAAFSTVTGAVTLATLALYAAFQDDEDFKARDDWDRDNFWWFKLPGMDAALRVPKPFEIGAIATLAERTAEQIFDQGAEGKQFKDSLTRMVVDTFAFNLPQFIKPVVDLYANRDSFTGAPIESAGMERLSKAERAANTTSPLAIALGGVANVALPEKLEVSPVQMDYAIKAYFGWLGGSIAWASKYAVMPFKEGAYPDENWVNTASIGFVRTLPANQSRYVTSFYDWNKKISQAYADMRHYAEIGQADKVQDILEEKGDLVGMAKFYDKTSKNMANIRNQIRVVTADAELSGAEKRQEIDRLKQLISELAQQAEDARKSLKQ
jgi:hypothetical protein